MQKVEKQVEEPFKLCGFAQQIKELDTFGFGVQGELNGEYFQYPKQTLINEKDVNPIVSLELQMKKKTLTRIVLTTQKGERHSIGGQEVKNCQKYTIPLNREIRTI